MSIVIGGCSQTGKNNNQNSNNQTDVETQNPGNDKTDNKQDEESNKEIKEEAKTNEEIPEKILEEYEDALIVKKNDGTIEVYESIEVEEETPFVKIKKNGEKVYLSELSPEVIMLSKAVAEYGKALNDIDWETATGWEGYDLMTPEGKKGYEEDNIEQIALDFYKTYKIKRKFLGIESFNYVEFNGDEAIVDVDFAFMYENVENLANYKVGKPYYAPVKLRYKFINDQWLMDEMLEARQIYSYEEE
jgi:hypothetical protein